MNLTQVFFLAQDTHLLIFHEIFKLFTLINNYNGWNQWIDDYFIYICFHTNYLLEFKSLLYLYNCTIEYFSSNEKRKK